MAITIEKKASTSSVYDKHLDSTPIEASMSITKKVGKSAEMLMKEEHKIIHPGVMIPADQLYLLSVEGSHTINLGNYESARIGVTLRVPTTKPELEEAYSWATTWVTEHIDQAVNDAKGL